MCKTEIVNTICGVPVANFAVKPTPSEIAGLFCELTDDQMAEFFVAVNGISKTWPGDSHYQFYLAGKHLAECSEAQACGAAGVVEALNDGYVRYRDKIEAGTWPPLDNRLLQRLTDEPTDPLASQLVLQSPDLGVHRAL